MILRIAVMTTDLVDVLRDFQNLFLNIFKSEEGLRFQLLKQAVHAGLGSQDMKPTPDL